ncbi:hypothetical protein [Fulvimarina sp. MAC8]|uniref:hypothetical protein n=1 Tax=Fulvimarina sp. MAC8 TaxID=3162874 RepID=UPI0032EC53EA
MTSDTDKNFTSGRSESDHHQADEAIRRETDAAKAEAKKSSDAIRDRAAEFSGQAKDRANKEAERGKESVAGGMNDFAAAVKKAADELGERDQSMGANVMREVASGLEDASRSLKGNSVQDLTRSVADFARRQPTAFLVGAALAGVALGRFARSSSEHDHDHRYSSDRDRSMRSSAGRATAAPAHRTPTAESDLIPRGTQETTEAGAFPRRREGVEHTSAPNAGTATPAAPRPASAPIPHSEKPSGATYER